MTLEEIKAIEGLKIEEIRPGAKYLILYPYDMPLQTMAKLGSSFKEFFGAEAAFVRSTPTGELKVLEIKP